MPSGDAVVKRTTKWNFWKFHAKLHVAKSGFSQAFVLPNLQHVSTSWFVEQRLPVSRGFGHIVFLRLGSFKASGQLRLNFPIAALIHRSVVHLLERL